MSRKWFQVKLIGFFDEPLYLITLCAENRVHAIKLAALEYNQCYKRAEIIT
jgi:hypothetical protein